MSERSQTVLVVGHSRIRLSEFVCKYDRGTGSHATAYPYDVALNFKASGAFVIFRGVGGLKVDGLISPSVLQAVETHRPCAMIFMIGDNDKVSECNTEEQASKIVATTSYFHYAWHIPSIAVTQLLPRLITRHLDNA